MKHLKTLGVIFVLTLMMVLQIGAKTHSTTSKIMCRGEIIELPSIIKDNTTYVGARALGDATHVEVSYVESIHSAYFTTYFGRLTINLNTGETEFNQSDRGIAPIILDNGSTYLPLRYICENLGFTVGYENGIITIATNGQTTYDIENPELLDQAHLGSEGYYMDYLYKFDLLRELLCDSEESGTPIDMVRMHKVVDYMTGLESKLKGTAFEAAMTKYKLIAEKVIADFEDDGKLKSDLRKLLIDTTGFIYEESLRFDIPITAYNTINKSSYEIMGWDIE